MTSKSQVWEMRMSVANIDEFDALPNKTEPKLREFCCAEGLDFNDMDLETLNPVAPEPLLKSFPEGLYWTLTYDRGVRLRVMPIDGDSGFSAIFFDEV